MFWPTKIEILKYIAEIYNHTDKKISDVNTIKMTCSCYQFQNKAVCPNFTAACLIEHKAILGVVNTSLRTILNLKVSRVKKARSPRQLCRSE